MTVVVTLLHRLLSLIGFMGFLQVSIQEIIVVSIMLKHLIRVEIECLSRIIGRREGSATVKVSFGVEIPRGRDCRIRLYILKWTLEDHLKYYSS